MTKLARDFYARDALSVAKDLLGKLIVRIVDGQELSAMIVETEAYMGTDDKAAHFFGGRRTPRVEVIYGEPGYSYVFFVYGMHHCFNIVTGCKGVPQAVLIRAAEPICGIEQMARNRYKKPYAQLEKKQLTQLTNGPGKLCQALGIDRSCNCMDLCGGELFLTDHARDAFEIVSSKRIGIDYAQEARAYPWRMYIRDNCYVSRVLKINRI
ncbi:MAG: DNA-3-methyladenine glycosylase [Spirochaetia bacterium]|jgi:DNA-3-methyladenine glycosylase|nr:DNA-3-methyladenine glycosylase [Spirochaetia bacterium]